MGYLTKEEHIKVDRSGKKVKLIRSGDVAKVPAHPKLDAKIKEYHKREREAKRKRKAARNKRWNKRIKRASDSIITMEKNLESIGNIDFDMDFGFGSTKKRKKRR